MQHNKATLVILAITVSIVLFVSTIYFSDSGSLQNTINLLDQNNSQNLLKQHTNQYMAKDSDEKNGSVNFATARYKLLEELHKKNVYAVSNLLDKNTSKFYINLLKDSSTQKVTVEYLEHVCKKIMNSKLIEINITVASSLVDENSTVDVIDGCGKIVLREEISALKPMEIYSGLFSSIKLQTNGNMFYANVPLNGGEISVDSVSAVKYLVHTRLFKDKHNIDIMNLMDNNRTKFFINFLEAGFIEFK